MDEIKRFMRYTLPGLVCTLQLIIAFIFSDTITVKCFYNNYLKSSNDFGIVLGIFFVSGAIGYILSSIYFSIRWWEPISQLFSINHLILFKTF